MAIKEMKFAPISRFRSGLLLATVSFLLNTVSVCFADQFGTTVAPDWQNWAAFSQGGGVTSTTTVYNQGGGRVDGDVGVWGTGNITLSGGAIINGDLYYRSTGKLTRSGGATITGAQHHDAAGDAILQQSSNEAFMESDQLWAMPPTPGYPTTINTGQNMTITGTGHVVLKLTDFVLSGGTFTLVGTSPATTFVFNVSRNFSLGGSARIVLSGITPSNVVFNVRGTGTDANISGSSSFQGILLANFRNVNVNSTVNGEIVGNKITIGSGGRITHASP